MRFEQFTLQVGQLLLSEDADIIVVLDILLHLFDVLLHRLTIGLVPKPILQVPFVEVAYHILRLVLAAIYLLDSIEDNDEDNFMGHDPCSLVEMLVALLDALNGGLKHVLWLTIDANAYSQPDLSLGGSLEQRE